MRSDAYVSYRGSAPFTASCMAACTIANIRESWTGVAGAVRAAAYHAGMTWADVTIPDDAS